MYGDKQTKKQMVMTFIMTFMSVADPWCLALELPCGGSRELGRYMLSVVVAKAFGGVAKELRKRCNVLA